MSDDERRRLRLASEEAAYSYRRSSVLWGASIIHLAQAMLLIASAEAAGATPVHSIVWIVGGRHAGAGALILCSLLSLWAILGRHRDLVFRLALLLPQQALLSLVAAGGLIAMMTERYADGVLRPLPFVMADQLPSVAMFGMHTYALVRGARWP